MKELIVATTNQGKVKEIQAMLKDLNIEVKSLKDVYDEVPDIIEDGKTFKENALISISARENGEYVVIKISDNGVGVEGKNLMLLREQLNAQALNYTVEETDHIGLANINKRLKLFYGTDCGLEVDGKVDGGFITTVTIKKSPPNPEKSIM